MEHKLLYDSLLIALGVVIPAAIYVVPRSISAIRKKRELSCKRDAAIAQVIEILAAIQDDMQCLYSSQLSQLESLEVTLIALKGEKINGNVTDALESIRQAKQAINTKLLQRVGCSDQEVKYDLSQER